VLAVVHTDHHHRPLLRPLLLLLLVLHRASRPLPAPAEDEQAQEWYWPGHLCCVTLRDELRQVSRAEATYAEGDGWDEPTRA
jgi:hypothetical protein